MRSHTAARRPAAPIALSSTIRSTDLPPNLIPAMRACEALAEFEQ